MSIIAGDLTEVEEEQFLSIDEMIPYVGEFKRYQWRLGAMFCAAILPVAPQVLLMYFAALNPTWRCVENSTLCIYNGTLPSSNHSRCSLARSEWEFTQPKEYSIVTYFDIYCDKSWLIDLSSSIIFAGSGCGSLLVGWAADNYGRKNIIYFSTAMIIISGFLASFMPNVYLVISFRFIIGFFLCGTYQSSVLLSEIVANDYRPLAGTLIWCFFPVSYCLMGIKAYFIRSWKTLFIVCSAPYALVIGFYFFTPESPRWLRLNGKMEELTKTFLKIARFNNKIIPCHLSISPAPNLLQKKSSNPLSLLRRGKIALLTINLGYAGFVNALLYYGFSLIASDFGGSLYLNFILLSLTEIPAGFACIILCDRVGRKKTTIFGVFIAGIACVCLVFLNINNRSGKIIFGMVGKFFITLSFNSLAIWVIELYPTSLRSQAYCFNNVMCTIGSASAPWMVTRLSTLHPTSPYICMGITAFLCSISMLFIKETKSLPTLECDDDSYRRDSNSEFFPFLLDTSLSAIETST